MVGSIIGVGIANQIMHGSANTRGVDGAQAEKIVKSRLISPVVGFVGAALLLLAVKEFVPNKKLYEAPEGTDPPPFFIRALLLLTSLE